MGMLVDKVDLGFGKWSWCYFMLVKNGVVDKMFIELDVFGDLFEVFDVDIMFKYIVLDEEIKVFVLFFIKFNCLFCLKVKMFLIEKGYDYEEIVLGKGVLFISFLVIMGREIVF